MSEIAQDTAPRIFIVTGTNFSSEVSFEDGDMNLECGLEQQVYECGSRVIAALNGDNPHNLQIVINNESKGEPPQVGTILLVGFKGQDPHKQFTIFTHACLADNGLYLKAAEMETLFKRQLAGIKEQAETEKKRSAEREEELKNFDLLKESMLKKPSPPKKPRKKKS